MFEQWNKFVVVWILRGWEPENIQQSMLSSSHNLQICFGRVKKMPQNNMLNILVVAWWLSTEEPGV